MTTSVDGGSVDRSMFPMRYSLISLNFNVTKMIKMNAKSFFCVQDHIYRLTLK
jgi:hypothetical protein